MFNQSNFWGALHTPQGIFINQIKLLLLENSNLVFQFCSDKVTVQAGDVADREDRKSVV